MTRQSTSMIGGSCHKYRFCCNKRRVLSQQTGVCCNKSMLVTTNIIFLQQNFCHDKQNFVTPKDVFCHDKCVLLQQTCLLSWQKCLWQQNFCHDKNDACGSSFQRYTWPQYSLLPYKVWHIRPAGLEAGKKKKKSETGVTASILMQDPHT